MEIHPQTEDCRGYVNPLGRQACCDEGKRCAETLFFDYHRQNGVRIKVARIFNIYDPNDGRVVSNFIVQALKHEDITLARRVLGWELKIGLEAGSQRTIGYFDALLPTR